MKAGGAGTALGGATLSEALGAVLLQVSQAECVWRQLSPPTSLVCCVTCAGQSGR